MYFIRQLFFYVTILTTVAFCSSCKAKSTSLFENYDFSKGGYSIVGHKSNKNSQDTELADFMLDKIETLNLIKRKWLLGENVPTNACGYNYYIHIVKAGEVLEKIGFNFEDKCTTVVTQQGSFMFDKKHLTRVYDTATSIELKQHSFKTLEAARVFLKETKLKPDVALVQPVRWSEFDGSFRVSVVCEAHNYDKSKFNSCIKRVEDDLVKQVPRSSFKLVNSGSSKDKILITVTGNKKLIDLFQKEEIYFVWKEFAPLLNVYWKAR